MNRKKRLVLCLLLCLSMLLAAGCNTKARNDSFSQLHTICELATLRCYYHNVAKYMDGQNSLFHLGYKKIWMEYAGIVTVGIDASKVTVSKPDKNGVVKVTIPKAEVLAIDFDEHSIAEITETGLLASITAKNRADTLAYAQADMEKTARENSMILRQGQTRAKKVIEEYIEKIGTGLGKPYTVEWVEVE